MPKDPSQYPASSGSSIDSPIREASTPDILLLHVLVCSITYERYRLEVQDVYSMPCNLFYEYTWLPNFSPLSEMGEAGWIIAVQG